MIKRSSDFLEKKGVDSPRLQVELLLAHILHVPRLNLYMNFERQLSDTELETLRALVKRRGDREPLQYILGTASFCGLEMAVTPSVLIPRPETEVLAERAWEFARSRGQNPLVLDFATGSGCLAIAIAVNCPAAQVHAIDISAEALEIARENARAHRVAVTLHQAASIAEVPQPGLFDLIVSNPPYIASAEVASLQPEVRDHEPRTALDGGTDGLDFYRLIGQQARERLAEGGRLMMETGDGQAVRASQIFQALGWKVERPVADLSGHPRILIAHR